MIDLKKRRRDFALYAYSVARRGRSNSGGGSVAAPGVGAPEMNFSDEINSQLLALLEEF